MLKSRTVGVQSKPTINLTNEFSTSKLERWSYWLVLAYLATQCWGIPLMAIRGLSWALWPLPSDVVWLAIFPIAVYTWLHGAPQMRRIRHTLIVMGVFAAYTLLSFILAKWRFELPDTQISYFVFSAFRLFQYASVWFVAANIRFTPARQQRVIQVLVITSLIVSVSALLEQIGTLDYRLLVSHLPSDTYISGPWAGRTIILPDAALGTLNYNRIYVGHYLSVVIIMVLMSRRLSWLSFAAVMLAFAALLATQSRTALIALVVAGVYAFIVTAQFRRILVIVGLLGVVLISLFLASGTYSLEGVSSIETRSDSIDESLSGRFERQSVALDIFFEDEFTPVFGVGLSNLGYFWLGGGFSPGHGQYATTLAETGVVGLLIFLSILVIIWRSIWCKAQFAIAVQAVLISNVIGAVFNDQLLPSPSFGTYLGLLLLLIGLSVAAKAYHEDPMCVW